MSSTKKLSVSTSVRRLEPQAKLPSTVGLSGLSPADIEELKRRLAEPVECVFDSAFQRDEAENTFMGPLPDRSDSTSEKQELNEGSGVDLLSLASGRALSADQERHVFLR